MVFLQIAQWMIKSDLDENTMEEGGAKYYPHSIDQSEFNYLFIKII